MDPNQDVNQDQGEDQSQDQPQDQGQMSPRDRLRQKMQAINPQKDYGSGDDDINDMLDLHDKHEAAANKLAEGIKKYPAMAGVFGSMAEGKHPLHAIVSGFGKDVMDMDPESEEFANIVKSQDEYSRKQEDLGKSDKEFHKNMEESGKVFQEFAESKQMDDKAFSDWFQKFYEYFGVPILSGAYNLEVLQKADDAMNHDDHVAQAQQDGIQAGVVATKNAKIIAKNKDMGGDNIPSLHGSPAPSIKQPEAEGKGDIWDKWGNSGVMGKSKKRKN
jgi:hypothetical protein